MNLGDSEENSISTDLRLLLCIRCLSLFVKIALLFYILIMLFVTISVFFDINIFVDLLYIIIS